MKKLVTISLLIMCILMVLPQFTIFGAAYSSYTYSIKGTPVDSPDAYTPDRQVDKNYMCLPNGVPFASPSDMTVDKDNNLYIVDNSAIERGDKSVRNGRIIMLDKNYKYVMSFGEDFINDQGVPDSLNAPGGMYVWEHEDLEGNVTKLYYVADTENNRIVIFNEDGSYNATVLEPRSQLMGEGAIFKPVAVAVDADKNIYVVSSTTYMGIIVMNRYGEFQGFLGAQKAAVDPLAIFWRQFQTAEQIAQSQSYVSTEYNNITIDDEGFVYVTTSSIDEALQQQATEGKSSEYAPVKKLNASGNDVLSRSGFFGPGGEVFVFKNTKNSNTPTGASKIVDVALGPEGTWSIIDEKRSKVYTYDQYGRLLHIFGDKGKMLGNIESVEAIVYQEEKILLLDKSQLNITVYNRTEYGDIIINALHNNNERDYDRAVDDWNSILQRNGNFDAAYVGIGKAYYRDGRWDDAMEYFKYAYDTENYSLAFQMYRKEWVSKYALVVPVVIVVVVFGLAKLFGWAGKVNKKATLMYGKKRTFKMEVLYAFHLFTHPFDGFWDLKHEKRGSVRGAIFWVVLAVLSFTYQAIGQAYLFNPSGLTSSIFVQALSILVPLFLIVAANWCLTTLFEGEGSFKDIFIAVSYSLAPLPFFVIPSTLLTHIFSLNEAGLVSLLVTIAWAWVAILVVCGLMITHGYSIFSNLLACVGTIVGAVFIMFVCLLFTGLIQKIVGFISSIVTELSYRS